MLLQRLMPNGVTNSTRVLLTRINVTTQGLRPLANKKVADYGGLFLFEKINLLHDEGLEERVVKADPGRVILNPGFESTFLEEELRASNIGVLRACTPVLLKTGQF